MAPTQAIQVLQKMASPEMHFTLTFRVDTVSLYVHKGEKCCLEFFEPRLMSVEGAFERLVQRMEEKLDEELKAGETEV
jgi:hypothetical protein